MRSFLALLLVPFFAFAQTAITTIFPADSVPLSPEALKLRLMGNSFLADPASGAQLLIQYKESYAFVNSGNFSDSGIWSVQDSKVCVEWRKLATNCSEIRTLGDVLLIKRVSNGEIMVLRLRT